MDGSIIGAACRIVCSNDAGMCVLERIPFGTGEEGPVTLATFDVVHVRSDYLDVLGGGKRGFIAPYNAILGRHAVCLTAVELRPEPIFEWHARVIVGDWLGINARCSLERFAEELGAEEVRYGEPEYPYDALAQVMALHDPTLKQEVLKVYEMREMAEAMVPEFAERLEGMVREQGDTPEEGER